MRRQFAVILLLISILSLSGCHKEPSTPNALVPSIMYNGEIYCSTGKQMPGEVAEDAIIGEITSTVPLPFIRIQRAFVPNFFQKICPHF